MTPRTGAAGTAPALTPHGTPQGRESIAAVAPQHPQPPFRCLYRTHSLQPKRSAEPHITSTHGEAKPHLPRRRNTLLAWRFYKYLYPTHHASREKTHNCLGVLKRKKNRKLSLSSPKIAARGGAAAPAQPPPAPTGAHRAAAQQGITVRLASHTQRGFVRQKGLPEGQRTHCRLNGTIDWAQIAGRI